VWVQNLLTWVFGAVVPLTQLQSDLYSFLLGLAGVAPAENGPKGTDGVGRSVAVDQLVESQLRRALLLAGVPGVVGVAGMPLTGKTAAATLAGIAASIFNATSEVGRASLLPEMAPPARNDAIPMGGLRPFFPHGFNDLPRAASLWALTAVALPGIGGLLILSLAGVRIGYRQAKAGFAVQTAGIAHFARPGPLGVVRSGSLVAVRPRGLHVVPPGALSGRPILNVA
jgi:hypothetical protein